MGGSKGQSTQTSNQTQTYAPNPAAMGYITDALGRAQQTANLGFNVPQAPVAGFSDLQNQGFSGVQGAQSLASPFYSQAANYFSPQGAQAFYNPMADAVTAQMKNIFGQQQSQATGQLTQAAGGVGADRIAVGQANLANQQGLAAGQTYADLYSRAQQQAQQAGQNYQNLGTTAQGTALQGANALLGAGNLQQQQAQAQLNAPYQQQVAQAQFPYQQAQWYSNIVGGLAPGLGGTTQGTGTTTATPAQPSIWSQVLGGGAALAGGLGQSGAFGSNGWLTGSNPAYGGGNWLSGDAYGGNSANPLPGLSASDYGAGYAEGGEVSDEPIDISANPFIQTGQIAKIAPHVPQLNMSQPQQSGGGGSGGGFGDVLKTAASILPFFLARGGGIPNPFASGGEVSDQERQLGMDYLRQAFTDPTRQQGMDVLRDQMQRQYGINPNDPIRLPDEAATQAWRNSTPLPDAGSEGTSALALAPGQPAPDLTATTPSQTAAAAAPVAEQGASAAAGQAPARQQGFIDSPWAALTAAGLGIMGGTSPFAGVNIGQGGQKGLAMLQQQRENAQKDESTALQAKRLEQEAQQHLDSMNQMTPYQRESLALQKQRLAAAQTPKEKPLPASLQKDLGEKATSFNQLKALESGFKPSYGGSVLPQIGDMQNWIARQTGVGNTDAADWWSQYQGFQNKVRHELFGSALTATEAAQWEKQSINPGMAPDRIKTNLAKQREIIEGALRRRAASLAKQGYSKEGIDAEIGADSAAQPATPKVGDVKTNAHGVRGRWTGSGWEVVQ